METPAIKANFVPKQQTGTAPSPQGSSRKRSSSRGLIVVVAAFVFVVALSAWGGLLAYEYILNQEKALLEDEIGKAVAAGVNLDEFERLKTLDQKMIAVERLLNEHVNVQPLFFLLEQVTLTNSIRFSDFSYTLSEERGVRAVLSGVARSFASVSYQQKVLLEHPHIISAEFSGLSLNEETGDIPFSLDLTFSSELISYLKDPNSPTP